MRLSRRPVAEGRALAWLLICALLAPVWLGGPGAALPGPLICGISHVPPPEPGPLRASLHLGTENEAQQMAHKASFQRLMVTGEGRKGH